MKKTIRIAFGFAILMGFTGCATGQKARPKILGSYPPASNVQQLPLNNRTQPVQVPMAPVGRQPAAVIQPTVQMQQQMVPLQPNVQPNMQPSAYPSAVPNNADGTVNPGMQAPSINVDPNANNGRPEELNFPPNNGTL